MRKKSLTKDQREIQIIQWFANRIQEDNYETASLAQIAKGIGMSPSSHLRHICENLVNNQTLIAVVIQRPGRWDGRGYMLTPGKYKRPARTAVINFTRKGIHYQLEQLL